MGYGFGFQCCCGPGSGEYWVASGMRLFRHPVINKTGATQVSPIDLPAVAGVTGISHVDLVIVTTGGILWAMVRLDVTDAGSTHGMVRADLNTDTGELWRLTTAYSLASVSWHSSSTFASPVLQRFVAADDWFGLFTRPLPGTWPFGASGSLSTIAAGESAWTTVSVTHVIESSTVSRCLAMPARRNAEQAIVARITKNSASNYSIDFNRMTLARDGTTSTIAETVLSATFTTTSVGHPGPAVLAQAALVADYDRNQVTGASSLSATVLDGYNATGAGGAFRNEYTNHYAPALAGVSSTSAGTTGVGSGSTPTNMPTWLAVVPGESSTFAGKRLSDGGADIIDSSAVLYAGGAGSASDRIQPAPGGNFYLDGFEDFDTTPGTLTLPGGVDPIDQADITGWVCAPDGSWRTPFHTQSAGVMGTWYPGEVPTVWSGLHHEVDESFPSDSYLENY